MDNKKSQWTDHHHFFSATRWGHMRAASIFIAISYSCFKAKTGITKMDCVQGETSGKDVAIALGVLGNVKRATFRAGNNLD